MIAEARQVFRAKTAEREILPQAALRTARTREEVESLNENLQREHADARDAPWLLRHGGQRRDHSSDTADHKGPPVHHAIT